MARRTRQLGYGETPDPGWSGPHRFYTSHGYIVLRWYPKGGTDVVEIKEHRLVAGAKPGDHVHHKNGIKDDNRPENLEIISPSEHSKLHQTKHDVGEMARLYFDCGMSSTDVGKLVGCDASQVSRRLRAAGHKLRTASEISAAKINEAHIKEFVDAGFGEKTISRVTGIPTWSVAAALGRNGWVKKQRKGKLSSEEARKLEEVAGRLGYTV
jgi:hypothetical protein